MLEDLGHEVISVHSGEQALDVIKHGAAIDLMITDFSMPKMTGLELASAIREMRPALPVLLATGYAELPVGVEMDLPRLNKPYLQEQLAAEIVRVLQRKHDASPSSG